MYVHVYTLTVAPDTLFFFTFVCKQIQARTCVISR